MNSAEDSGRYSKRDAAVGVIDSKRSRDEMLNSEMAVSFLQYGDSDAGISRIREPCDCSYPIL